MLLRACTQQTSEQAGARVGPAFCLAGFWLPQSVCLVEEAERGSGSWETGPTVCSFCFAKTWRCVVAVSPAAMVCGKASSVSSLQSCEQDPIKEQFTNA